ncbi:hypothetical protein GW17_00050601 [Ensete ventricosum]|nr:hypothetical protein GW17_00050601 [Ensete ventricosum]RZS18419.1 hypothetical protein BHM03_00050670 [Ensete ventricosum]
MGEGRPQPVGVAAHGRTPCRVDQAAAKATCKGNHAAARAAYKGSQDRPPQQGPSRLVTRELSWLQGRRP